MNINVLGIGVLCTNPQKDIILMEVPWKLAYPFSYREIEEMVEERGTKWIIPRCKSGLFIMRLSLSKYLEKKKKPLVRAGEWMRLT